MILDNARTTRTEQYLVPLPATRVIRLTMRCNRPLPVCRFEKHVVPNEALGPLTQRLGELYRQDVAQKCGVQS